MVKQTAKEAIEQIGVEVISVFQQADSARDQGYRLHRKAIRACSKAIRATHRREFEVAEAFLSEAQQLIEETQEALRPFPAIYHGGFLRDAEKEMAEARITYALIRDIVLPTPEDVGVGCSAYISGMAEAVGELRRYALDNMRLHDLVEAERALRLMDDIYYLLTQVDFPDGLTSGLRRLTDIARGCLEKTRGELTQATVQMELVNNLKG